MVIIQRIRCDDYYGKTSRGWLVLSFSNVPNDKNTIFLDGGYDKPDAPLLYGGNKDFDILNNYLLEVCHVSRFKTLPPLIDNRIDWGSVVSMPDVYVTSSVFDKFKKGQF